MRQLTSIEKDRIKLLTANSIEFTLIEPTETGLKKSIMDATAPVRQYLRVNGIHDFLNQVQGTDNKVLVDSRIITSINVINTATSLYRPVTKNGDPRIWVYKLTGYAQANDILALFQWDGYLYTVNITQLDISLLLNQPGANPLKDVVGAIREASNAIADELLFKLRKIAGLGWIQSEVSGDTGIGRTLETALGIHINSSRLPDYKGIELKSFRDSRSNRKTLFAQVPDWSLSKLKSSAEILRHFGYARGNDYKLYCTVATRVRNSQGLQLRMDAPLQELVENSHIAGDFVVWRLDTLHQRLLEKHNETFWIAADTSVEDGKEYFKYTKVEHTKKPIVAQFDILLDQGLITLDHLIKKIPSGKVVEKGPLFKIKPNALNLLFPPSEVIHLIE